MTVELSQFILLMLENVKSALQVAMAPAGIILALTATIKLIKSWMYSKMMN